MNLLIFRKKKNGYKNQRAVIGRHVFFLEEGVICRTRFFGGSGVAARGCTRSLLVLKPCRFIFDKTGMVGCILEDFENASPYFCTFLANRICD